MGTSLFDFELTNGSRHRDPFVFRLWTFVVVGLLLIIGASAYYLNWQHHKHLDQARAGAGQLVRTVGAQVEGQLLTIDKMLDVIGEIAFASQGRAVSDPALAVTMAGNAQPIVAGLIAVSVLDANGVPLRPGSAPPPLAAATEPGRVVMEWFRHNPSAHRYLGSPQTVTSTGQPAVVLARVFRKRGGESLGAVMAVLDPGELLHLFSGLQVGKEGRIQLLHLDDLALLSSAPWNATQFARPQSLPGLTQTPIADVSVLEVNAPGGRQIIAVRPLVGWPLLALAYASTDEVAERLWQDLQGYLAIMLSLALLMLVLAYAVYQAHRKSQESALLSQTVFDAAPMGLAVFSADGTCVAFNQAFLSQLAEPIPDLGGRHYSSLPGWTAAGAVALIGASLADGQTRSDMLRLAVLGGSERWLRFTASAVSERGRRHLLLTVFDLTEQVRARNALAESERRYREFYESSQEGIVRTDPSGRFLDANRAYLDMMGYGLTELRSLRVRDVTDAEDLALERRMVREQADVRGYADEYEKSQRRRDGTLVELSIRLWRIHDEYGQTAGYWSIVRDVTARKQTEAQRKLASMVFDSSSEAILLTDGKAKILTANPAFERITGYTVDEVIGHSPNMLSSGMQDDAYYKAMWDELAAEGNWEGEIWDRRKSGEIYLKWLRVNTIRDHEGGPVTHYVGVFSDITERRKAEEQIHFLAHHDALTGLPNRFSLRAQLEQMLGRARRDGGGLALMFIDLDNFKTINDSLGHHYGDQLLVKVAARLRDALREGDSVARLGGDEFVVVMPGAAAQADAIGVASKIIEALRQPYEVMEHVLHSSPSIGISLFPADGDDIDTLMKNADSAMYHAKSQGRNNFQFYAPHMNAAVAQRMALERALRKGLDAGQLLLHYQPQVDLRSGRLVGVEALVRWEDPVRGMIAPTEFIAVAEQSGLIIRLGAWVLQSACRQLCQWQERGIPIPSVSINVSPLQFRHVDFVPMVRQVLQETGVTPADVDLEITEGVLMESSDRSVGVLQDLRDLGVTFSIDDFGTGYSSLSYIRSFPAQRLKIDRSFVSNLEHEPNDAVIATAIIALAHSLGMQVVAEGVETPEQNDFLRDHDCDYAQGYYFSRPLTAKDIEAWVAEL